MPTVTKHKELRDYRIDQLRHKILYDRGKEIHAAYIDLCPLKSGYRNCLKDAPPVPEKSLLFFASGICMEAWLAPEQIEPQEKDGIIGSLDWRDTHFGAVEIKSTRSNMEYFNPLTSYPWWLTRLKTYCNIYGLTSMALEVFFWNGNRKDKQIAYDAWKIGFSPIELETHWALALRRRDVLVEIFDAISEGQPPPIKRIWLSSWECRLCEFKGLCEYHKRRE